MCNANGKNGTSEKVYDCFLAIESAIRNTRKGQTGQRKLVIHAIVICIEILNKTEDR